MKTFYEPANLKSLERKGCGGVGIVYKYASVVGKYALRTSLLVYSEQDIILTARHHTPLSFTS